MDEPALLAFADDLQKSCRYCAAISYFRTARLFGQPLPEPTDATATVTFIRFREQTYAVTAAHVVNDFRASVSDPEQHTFFIPKAPGHTLFDRFKQPPAGLIGKTPDVAIMKIDSGLPSHLGKEAFPLGEAAQPTIFPYALAVGYPTGRKSKRTDAEGRQIALECCQAVAEGVSTGHGDQVQFYSEITGQPEVTSLSGMSGGPVFWSDGNAYGLVGIVKQAMSNEQHSQAIKVGPIVHFICQRFSTDEFANWVTSLG
jgi:S1-C subfamily serine protease